MKIHMYLDTSAIKCIINLKELNLEKSSFLIFVIIYLTQPTVLPNHVFIFENNSVTFKLKNIFD